jgi:hypothetical protein
MAFLNSDKKRGYFMKLNIKIIVVGAVLSSLGNMVAGSFIPRYSPTVVSCKSYRTDTKIFAVPATWFGEWECNFSEPLSASGSETIRMEMPLSSMEGVCFIVMIGNGQREFLVYVNDNNPNIIMYSQDGGPSRALCDAGPLNSVAIIIRSDGTFSGLPLQ